MGITPGELEGVHVLVTRPAQQGEHLCRLIEQEQGTATHVPAIIIQPPADPTSAQAVLHRLTDFDLAIFVSTNAVEHALALSGQDLPGHVPLAAVGQRTAQALEAKGYSVAIQAPPPHNSEVLLATPALQDVAGKRIVIIRGEGGRELLGETLQARGAEVTYTAVYRRARPAANLDTQLPGTRIDCVVVTSNEALDNLLAMAAEHRQWLLSLPLVAISPRTARRAEELGFSQTPVTAQEATDPALVEAIKAWRRQAQREH